MESALIIHTGINGLTNGVNTMKNVRKLVKVLLEINKSEIYIGFSSVIYHTMKIKTLTMNEMR